jgi:hypothetical protein
MTSTPLICVKTPFFQIELGEEELTNPGIFGHALAKWLAEALKKRGEPVLDVLSEDWGWCILLMKKPYKLWIGCSNKDGCTDEWGAFVVAEPNFFQSLFRRVDSSQDVNRAHKILHEIMQEIPDISEIWTE